MPSLRWIPALALSLVGCAAVLDFDVAEDGEATSGVGASGTATSATSATGVTSGASDGGADASAGDTSSGSSQGGAGGDGAGGGTGCDGCLDNGVCVAGTSLDACGSDGGACESCAADDDCSSAQCGSVGCQFDPLPDGAPCFGGECDDGVCVQGAENCTDGEDNDSNGDVDCADVAACGDVATCIPEADSGWEGPFAVYEAVGEVGCPSVWPEAFGTLLHRDIDDTAFDCGTCGCDSKCTMELTTHRNTSCTDGLENIQFEQGDCLVSFLPPDAQSVEAHPLGFDCESQVTGRDPTKATWSTTVTLCGASDFGGGCGAAQCASDPPQQGDAVHLCIAKAGSSGCPTTGYTQPRPAFAAPAPFDDRACGACSCNEPSGDCGGTIGTHTDSQCTECGPGTPGPCYQIDEGCLDISQAVGLGYGQYVPEQQCTPSGGAETGNVGGTEAWSICCLD